MIFNIFSLSFIYLQLHIATLGDTLMPIIFAQVISVDSFLFFIVALTQPQVVSKKLIIFAIFPKFFGFAHHVYLHEDRLLSLVYTYAIALILELVNIVTI